MNHTRSSRAPMIQRRETARGAASADAVAWVVLAATADMETFSGGCDSLALSPAAA